MLGQIAGDQRFVAAKRNEVFVMIEYFGYLRRDPDASGYEVPAMLDLEYSRGL